MIGVECDEGRDSPEAFTWKLEHLLDSFPAPSSLSVTEVGIRYAYKHNTLSRALWMDGGFTSSRKWCMVSLSSASPFASVVG